MTTYRRYAKLETYTVPDRRGREVEVLPAASAPPKRTIGVHRRRDGQRIDHLAARYLDDGTAAWRIAEENNAPSFDALAEARDVDIPAKGR